MQSINTYCFCRVGSNGFKSCGKICFGEDRRQAKAMADDIEDITFLPGQI